MNRSALGFSRLASCAAAVLTFWLASELHGFSPTNVAGLSAWFDAASGAVNTNGLPAGDGDAVVTWEDQSGNGLDAFQADPADAPIFQADGPLDQPALSFANGTFLETALTELLDPGTGQTVFAVFSDEVGFNVPLISWGGGQAATGTWQVRSGDYIVSGDGPKELPGTAREELRLLTGLFDGTRVSVFHNGMLMDTDRVVHAAGYTQSMVIGTADAALPFEGNLCELLVYNHGLDASARSSVEAYLLGKYWDEAAFASVREPYQPTVLDPFYPALEIETFDGAAALSAWVWYRTNITDAFQVMVMTNDPGTDVYRATNELPVSRASWIEWYVQADYSGTNSGTLYWPEGGSNAPFRTERLDAADRQQGPSTRLGPLTISEIMYHPAAQPDGLNAEYVELFNTDPFEHDIGGYRISGAVDYTFPQGTVIKGRQRLVVADDPGEIEQLFGIRDVYGPFSGNLPNDSGNVRIRNASGMILYETTYEDAAGWPEAADGAGHSLVMDVPDYGEAFSAAWRASTLPNGNPGAANPIINDALTNVVINEILAHTDEPQFDYIELYNRGTQAVDLSGCRLSDDPDVKSYMVPSGTVLSAGGFMSFSTNSHALGFELAEGGETVVLRAPNDRVIDIVKFRAQENGVSLGRYPDGADGFHVLRSVTEAAANDNLLIGDVVINEVMYNPITGTSEDEYIELYNRGTGTVDLSMWQFVDGLRFTFPSGQVLNAGAYLVVAKNTNLVESYAQLNGLNTIGPYSGQLSDSGERLLLVRPEDPMIPMSNLVVVDEVEYGEGARWGEWADGGGSSLELVDAGADNRRAMNWQGSDETAKAPWTFLSVEGRIELGNDGARELQVLLLDEGECSVDDLGVYRLDGGFSGNRLVNPGFELGTSDWVIQGNHIQSLITTSDVHGGSQALHVKSTGKGDNGVNRLESDLTSTMWNGNTGRLEGWFRWRAGSPNVMLRTYGNWLDMFGRMDVPENLGTPGLANSRVTVNAGPSISGVTHDPLFPGAFQDVVVQARIEDVHGLEVPRVHYRLDPAMSYTTTNMNDLGEDGDRVAGDGTYAVRLPAQAANQILAYYVEAADTGVPSATNRYPENPDFRHEALIQFGLITPGEYLGTYRFILTEAARTNWASRQSLSDELVPGNFYYGDHRVIHDAGARFRGSPFVRGAGDPRYIDSSFVMRMPSDDPLLGTPSINLDRLERDDAKVREKTSYWMHQYLGLPYSHMRLVNLGMNESTRWNLYSDSLQVNRDYVASRLPDQSNGDLFKVDDWFEYNDDAQVGRNFYRDGQLDGFYNYTGALHATRYHWSWVADPDNATVPDYSGFLQLVEAINGTPGTEAYDALMRALVDVDEFIGLIALRHALADWDGYGYDRGKNASLFKPEGGKWLLLPWDLDMALGSWSTPTDSLRSINDPAIWDHLLKHPAFDRIYWQWIWCAAYGPFESALADPAVDNVYNALIGEGESVSGNGDIKTFIFDRRNYLLSQLGQLGGVFEITSNGGIDLSTDEPLFTLEGTAPHQASVFTLNGQEVAPWFASTSSWEISLALEPGTNLLIVTGYDPKGGLVGSDSITVTLTSQGIEPQGFVVINEVMYHPFSGNEEFIELYNLSDTYSFDLSGMRLNGADFTFAQGTILAPTQFLVIVENEPEFVARYGAGLPLAGVYNGTLDNGGEKLSLLIPGQIGTEDELVDSVRYEDSFPWPEQADGMGPSLQLIDPLNDNAVPANWGVDEIELATPGRANSIAQALPLIPGVRINEIQPRNVGTIQDNAGDFDPWLELFNQSGENVLAVEVHQAEPGGEDLAMDIRLFYDSPATVTTSQLFTGGADWKYLDTGVDQGTSWRETGFDDSSWSNGPGALGYGDGHIVTTLDYGPDSGDKYPTYYFRKEVVTTNADQYTYFNAHFQRDDGIVIYFNGAEVFRDNLPAGAISYTSMALNVIGGSEETDWNQTSWLATNLVAGTNVVAVEIHQNVSFSSDLGFDMGLDGVKEEVELGGVIVSSNAVWSYLGAGQEPGSNWLDAAFDDASWSTGPAPLGAGGDGEATMVPLTSTSYYFRHVFSVTNPVPMDPQVALRADDGAIVYLNGSEILRVNMPGGAVDRLTKALAPVEGTNELEYVSKTVSRQLLLSGNRSVDLDQVYLSDVSSNLLQWAYTGGYIMDPASYLLTWADGETGEQVGTNFHTSFSLNETGGVLALAWLHGTNVYVLDYLQYGVVGPSQSFGTMETDDRDFIVLTIPTPGAQNSLLVLPYDIRINEYMADNDSTWTSLVSGTTDWIELYNAGTGSVDLTDYVLTDNANEPFKWRFPSNTLVSPGEFLLVYASGEDIAASNEIHTSFGLSRNGEELALFDPFGVLLDWRPFGEQAEDYSEGSYPNGSSENWFMAIPTPGASNVLFKYDTILHPTLTNVTVSWHARPGYHYDLYKQETLQDTNAWDLVMPDLLADEPVEVLSLPVIDGVSVYRLHQKK